MSTKEATSWLAPLRRVQQVTASQQAGTELNPHYMWCTREFTLALDCGHEQTRTRYTDGDDFPQRVRCRDCPAVPSRGQRRRTSQTIPTFDPVAAALVRDMIAAAPDRQDEFLDWVRTYGGYVVDETRRQRAYAAMALTAVDSYLPDTDNERAHEVRSALQQWHEQPGEPARAAVRTAAGRLYNTQGRDGEWFAHRGIHVAAKLASPHPHNLHAAVEAPTWDTDTRAEWKGDLWEARFFRDLYRGAEEIAALDGDWDVVEECAAQSNDAAYELVALVEHHQPRIDKQHLGLCLAMLTAYQTALRQG